MKKVGLVLLGLTLGGLVMELVLRALGVVPLEQSPLRGYHEGHSTLGWVGTPDHEARFRGPEFDLVIANGPGGFRRSEVPFPGGSGEPRAADVSTTVFLGDSFTWGWGVAQGEVFTDRLQERVGPARRIVNHGVNAWGTAQHRLLVERLLASDPPAEIVLMFFGNDPEECVDDRGGKRPVYALEGGELALHNVPVRKALTGPVREFMKRSVVLSHLRSGANALGQSIRDEMPTFLEVAAMGNEPRGWPVCAALLGDIGRRCAEADVDFRIVYIPFAAEVVEGPGVSSATRRLLGETCAAADLDWLDLTPAFHAAWSERPDRGPRGLPFYYPLDQHWTAAGHELCARVLADHAATAWWSDS